MDVEYFHVCDLSGAISRRIYPVPSIWMLMRNPAMVLRIFPSFASREPGYFAIHHIFFGPVPSIRMLVRNPAMALHIFVVLISGTLLLCDTHYCRKSKECLSGAGSAMIIHFRPSTQPHFLLSSHFRYRDEFRRKDGSPPSSKGMTNKTRTSSWRTSSTVCTRISIA